MCVVAGARSSALPPAQAFVDGEVFSLKTLIDANIDKRPVFFDGTIGGYTKTDDAHELAYDFRQVGLTKQVCSPPLRPAARRATALVA